MIKKLILSDVKNNKLLSAATVFFMTSSAMLISLAVMLSADLFGAVGKSAERANIPCGVLLKLLGADSFSFVIDGASVYFMLPKTI